MKFGLRKPSFKKSFSARTSGQFNRAVKRALIPGYGRRGVGFFTNPSKWLYNKVYRITSAGLMDLIKANTSHPETANRICVMPDNEYDKTQNNLQIRRIGLQQCEVVTKFSCYCFENYIISNAVKKLRARLNNYLKKGVYCGVTFYQFAELELSTLIENGAMESTRMDCKIAREVLEQLEKGYSFDLVVENMQQMYRDLLVDPVVTCNVAPKKIEIPAELFINPHSIAESEI